MIKLNHWRAQLSDPHMREMLLGSLAGLVVKVLAAGSLFVMNVVVTRTLGAAESGLFFLAFTLITIIATTGRLGLDQAIVRFIARDSEAGSGSQRQSIYAKALAWTFVATTALSFLLWLCASWLNTTLFKLPGFTGVFKNMLVAAPLVALYIIHAQALQGLKRVSQSMFVASVCLPVCILILLVVMPVKTAQDLSLYFGISSILTLFLGWVLWLKSAPREDNQTPFSSDLLRKTCTPLWIVAIVHQIIQWSSQLLLGVWGDAEAVAFFATSQRTAMLSSFVLFAVNAIAAPKFAAMHAQGDMQGVKRMAILSVRLMLLVSVPITVFILLFPDWLMSIFGDEFRAASTALMILSLGQFINIATGSVGYLLSMTGNETKVRDNVIISGILSVVAGLALIPAYGVVGASIAYALGVASQNLLGVYQVKKQLGFNTLKFWQA